MSRWAQISLVLAPKPHGAFVSAMTNSAFLQNACALLLVVQVAWPHLQKLAGRLWLSLPFVPLAGQGAQ